MHDDLTLELGESFVPMNIKEVMFLIIYTLDFLREARNAERSRESLKNLDYVYVPKVHWNLTKKVNISYRFQLIYSHN